jgi:CRISPR/Cas system CMR-associated protein Cmr1 (group 7 of RAMP superfamily)
MEIVGVSKYKYNPEDYKNYKFLSDDIRDYYLSIENHNQNKTIFTEIAAEDKYFTLHLTLKQREIDSRLRHDLAEEIRDYMWGLLHG